VRSSLGLFLTVTAMTPTIKVCNEEQMISSKTKIGLLVLGNFVAGILLGGYVASSTDWNDLGQIGLFALVFAEAGFGW